MSMISVGLLVQFIDLLHAHPPNICLYTYPIVSILSGTFEAIHVHQQVAW